MNSKVNIREEVLLVLSERFGIAPAAVHDETRLQEDLDLDSIDLFDMTGAIEKTTGLSIELSDFVNAKTFGDFVQVLESLLTKAAAA